MSMVIQETNKGRKDQDPNQVFQGLATTLTFSLLNLFYLEGTLHFTTIFQLKVFPTPWNSLLMIVYPIVFTDDIKTPHSSGSVIGNQNCILLHVLIIV